MDSLLKISRWVSFSYHFYDFLDCLYPGRFFQKLGFLDSGVQILEDFFKNRTFWIPVSKSWKIFPKIRLFGLWFLTFSIFFDFFKGYLSAKRAAKGPTSQKVDHFPAKCAKIIDFYKSKRASRNSGPDLPDLLRSSPICRKRNIRCGTDPGFPTPGVRITVVYTNSLKWVSARYVFRTKGNPDKPSLLENLM